MVEPVTTIMILMATFGLLSGIFGLGAIYYADNATTWEIQEKRHQD